MRNVIVEMSVSLDGFVAPVKSATDHRSAPEDAALKDLKLDWLRSTGTHVMGRVTYEQMAGHWPYSSHEYAAPMNDLPKVVFSRTLAVADWSNSQIARGDIAQEIATLREQPGGDIVAWGGASFVQALARARLVDEYRLVVNPIALGDGLPLFKDLATPLRLQLVEATAYESGAVLHIYRPADAWARRAVLRGAATATMSPD
ncbi:MAG TPA: dihydrofolate reductase family protein [Solirubrobacteraceae bacterium]|jgi:dihydrofolate reductase